MTAVEIVGDVEATIRYWRTRGVTAYQISRQLHCDKYWPAIYARMILILTAAEGGVRLNLATAA